MDMLGCCVSELGRSIIDNQAEFNKPDKQYVSNGNKVDKRLKVKIAAGRALVVDYMKLYNVFADVRFLKDGYNKLKEIMNIFPNNHNFYIRDKVKMFVYEMLYLLSLGEYNDVRIALKNFEEHLKQHESLRQEFSETYELSIYMFQSFILWDKSKSNYTSGNMRLGDCGYEFYEVIRYEGDCDLAYTTTDAIVLSNTPSQINYSNKNVDSIRFCQSFELMRPVDKYDAIRRFVYGKEDVLTITGGIEDCIRNASETNIILVYLNGDSISYLNDEKTGYGIKLGNISQDSDFSHDENTLPHEDESFCLEDVLSVDILSTVMSESPYVFIIDCRHSNAFYKLNKERKDPLLLFLSPERYPPNSDIGDGKLFTLFMTCPRRAFYQICETEISSNNWKSITELLNKFMKEIVHWMKQHIAKYPKIKPFLADIVSRNYFLKYIFCAGSLRLHRDFSVDYYLPTCNFKELEEKIVQLPVLEEIIYGMADILNASYKFAYAVNLSING